MTDPRRKLPSVSALLATDGVQALVKRTHHRVVADAIRATVDAARLGGSPESEQDWVAAITRAVDAAQRSSLKIVGNATGVVLHTNLGRAPLAADAIAAMVEVASGYSNLEYDLNAGRRGSRYDHCVSLLRELTGAEDALVVNNNAAALVLALNTLAAGRSVVVSRGELVEIGGSFRVPDIMERSTARLVEIGTTNRTHLADYEAAITGETAALLKVHPSNFAMEGFVADVDVRDLAELSRARGVPLIHDLGSGLMVPLDSIGLTGEPTAGDVVKAGVSVVTMSGDKLLGGPQAGIILGSRDAVGRMRKNPLLRALRIDKLSLSALEATLTLYRDPSLALARVPILRAMAMPVAELRKRADALRTRVGDAATVVDSVASVGGGAFPAARIPSVALSITRDATNVEERLRHGDPAIVGRLADGQLLLDLRTLAPAFDDALVHALTRALPA